MTEYSHLHINMTFKCRSIPYGYEYTNNYRAQISCLRGELGYNFVVSLITITIDT
ncbi:DEHA2D19118p [Debaryomyces hansenii CBS767]|uniref:DEHA2D19118p n=1 Tax=Debaryomyces hansenii (strain ATCC 36239 / CBS 767 / BCRC 21394 / JCM 1990 / NBRC 0083 / IGC 2968) TaxID=284592 RepID=Q6BR50_DEBHA|nr:DEHA2D19118p [Debaryomyces hansenii CBS767]CAG87494.1 DEHA2D19118p [Debaryomyces hansenii CBS767]|eukprot:XP_459320.1 DEHA2D19118p [Debaryomyces hansenii CBS767]